MYKLHYAQVQNMGDLLNQYMLEDLFNIKVHYYPMRKSNLIAIGSGLSSLLYSDDDLLKIKQILYKPFTEHIHVWGTGFLNYQNGKDKKFRFNNVTIHSVRGNLTKRRVESILGNQLSIPTGDGGLLAERWVGKVKKKYSIGIVPHYKEQQHPLIKQLKNSFQCSKVIDITQNPKEVVQEIAACNTILSSSLHGLIIADSYHIPNLHIQLYKKGEKILGDGYKFADYYSCYNLKDNPITIDANFIESIDNIVNNYCINANTVDKIKESIFQVFPKL